MKTTIYIITITFFLGYFTSAQKVLAQNEAGHYLVGSSETMWINDVLFKKTSDSHLEDRTYIYQGIEGNPFLFEAFENGIIKLKDGKTYKGLYQFDKFANEIQFLKGDTIYAIAFPRKIEFIEIGNTRLIYSDYKLSETMPLNNEGSYFVELFDNKCKLLAKKYCILEEATETTGYKEAKPRRFVNNKDTYYVKIDDSPAIKIQNKKGLISIFNDKKNEITAYLKKEKITINEVDDLKKLVSYYNELIEKN